MGDKGGPDIPQRNLSQELPQLFGAFKRELPMFNNQWFNKQPLLSESRSAALQGLSDIPSYQAGYDKLMEQLQGFQGQFGDVESQLRGYQGALGELLPQLQGYKQPYQDVVNYLNPILQSGGALTPEGERTATQEALRDAARGGMATTTPGLFSAALNREQYRQQRYNQALQQSESATNLLGQLTGEQAGIIGQQGNWSTALANMLGQQGALTAESGALLGAKQDVTGKAIQPALATEQTATKTYSDLFNPLLAYISDLFSSNQNAAAAENVAGSNKKGSTTGSTIGALGSIIGAVL
jgi:hypothetical protein